MLESTKCQEFGCTVQQNGKKTLLDTWWTGCTPPGLVLLACDRVLSIFPYVSCKLLVGASESLELLTFRRLYPRPIGRGTFTSRSPDWLRLVLVVGIIERQASFGLWVQSKGLTAGWISNYFKYGIRILYFLLVTPPQNIHDTHQNRYGVSLNPMGLSTSTHPDDLGGRTPSVLTLAPIHIYLNFQACCNFTSVFYTVVVGLGSFNSSTIVARHFWDKLYSPITHIMGCKSESP